MDHFFTSAKVVDLLRYRETRTERTPAPTRPSLAPVSPFRPLTAKQTEHRRQMLRFMREVSGY